MTETSTSCRTSLLSPSCAGVAGGGWQPLARPRGLLVPVPGCGADTVKAPAGSGRQAARHSCTEPNLPSQDVRAAGTGLCSIPGCCRVPWCGGLGCSRGRNGNGVGTGTRCVCRSCSAPAPLPGPCGATGSATSWNFISFFSSPDRASPLEHRSQVRCGAGEVSAVAMAQPCLASSQSTSGSLAGQGARAAARWGPAVGGLGDPMDPVTFTRAYVTAEQD